MHFVSEATKGAGRPKHIFDADFRYTPAVDTDLAKKFERIQREQKSAKQQQAELAKAVQGNIRALKRRAG